MTCIRINKICRQMGAEESKSSCCPTGSWPLLKTEYKGKGEMLNLEGVQVYHVGSGKKVLLMVSDIFGAKSGRHEAAADTFAELGFNVYLPQLLCKSYDGPMDMGAIMQVIKAQEYSKLEERMDKVVRYLEKQGLQKFHCIAFCWGVWAAFKFASKYPNFVSIAGMHPALGVEQAFGGNEMSLAASVKCPAFLYPAANDSENIKEKGEFINLLQQRFGSDKAGTLTFPDMQHGWTVRGDLKEPNVLRDVQSAFEHSHKFFSKFDL